MSLVMITLLLTIVTPVFAVESLTDEDYFVNVNADGSGFRIEFGKGNNKNELVIWSFYEFDDENEDHKFQDNELIEATYRFGADTLERKQRHEPQTNIDEEWLHYRFKFEDGTRIAFTIYLRRPNLVIDIQVVEYDKKQPWNDITIIYEINDRGKSAVFEYQTTEQTITTKLNRNFLDDFIDSLPF
ncbi:hypothetical protein [Candidatus Borrarchaeum sp.]|uniref:hypothetical protein n=1 Tax=Candidatus Borrarchaeum sp. TaxID=2846742 RepID=UPI0025810965|nr:hypothetical protein [Candidatus Borrarchaeum sp.]